MTCISLSLFFLLPHFSPLPPPPPVLLNFSLIYSAFDYELKGIANGMLLVAPPLIAIFD